jgi:peptidyl-prolyl isomerase G (cyclophilin G)
MLNVFSVPIPEVDETSTTSRTENVNTQPRKKRKRRELTPEDLETPPAHLDKKETEEEYDARLEREEAERQGQERKQILLHIKKTFSEEPESTGVRYKGKYNTQYWQLFFSDSPNR